MVSPAAVGDLRVRAARLLDVDPELAETLDLEGQRRLRHRAVVPVLDLRGGAFAPFELAKLGDGTFALLVCDGILVRELQLAGAPSADLLGPGDLITATPTRDALLEPGERWHASTRATVALLDDRLLPALRAYPSLAACLITRAARQAARASDHRAIAQLPRVELRLRALFWHLGARWGRIGADGVVLPLDLTHDAMGRLVGARRPTVTLALGELVREGLLERRSDGAWLLPRGSNPSPGTVVTIERPTEARLVAVPEPPVREPPTIREPVSSGDLALRRRSPRSCRRRPPASAS